MRPGSGMPAGLAELLGGAVVEEERKMTMDPLAQIMELSAAIKVITGPRTKLPVGTFVKINPMFNVFRYPVEGQLAVVVGHVPDAKMDVAEAGKVGRACHIEDHIIAVVVSKEISPADRQTVLTFAIDGQLLIVDEDAEALKVRANN